MSNNENNNPSDKNKESFFDRLCAQAGNDDFLSSLFNKGRASGKSDFMKRFCQEKNSSPMGFGVCIGDMMNSETMALSTMAVFNGVFELYAKNKAEGNQNIKLEDLEKVIFSSILQSIGLNPNYNFDIQIMGL